MQFKDYYETLGVSRGADAEEVKRAYRKQARKYHPDVSKEKNAEEKFKNVQEAYEVLKDPEKRDAYDQLGRDYRSGQQFRPPPDWQQQFGQSGFGHSGGHRFSDLNGFSDFFSSLFGAAGGGGAGAGGGGGHPPRGADGGQIEVSVGEGYARARPPGPFNAKAPPRPGPRQIPPRIPRP